MNETTDVTNPVPNKCEVCGRQDDTVRFVVYPYVFSVVVFTFQQAFSGCWCRFHRVHRWLAASFITSIFGWLGIPFGIIFTPVRLLQLAHGGLLDKDINGRILRAIGDEKHRNGDVQGAIRCFEASLLYVDDPGIKEQLRSLYWSQSTGGESSVAKLIGFFIFPAISVSFALVGMFVGVVDFIVQWISSFISAEIPIYILILLQAPFVILVYFCVVLVSYAFQFAVRWTGTNSSLFLSAVSVVTALFFINGIVSGDIYGIYLNYYMNGFRELPEEIGTTLMAILTHGGFYIFSPALLSSNFLANMLFAILLLLSFSFSLLVFIPKAKALTVQQMHIRQLQSSEFSSEQTIPLFGWVGIIGVVVIFVLLFVATPQKSSVDGLEAFDHVGLALGYASSGEFDQAVSEYRKAIDLRPQFPLAYAGLGYAYYFAADFDQARENFEFALSLQPDSVEARSGLGWMHLQVGDNDLASKEFREVLRIDPQSLDAHLGLGWVYFYQFDVENSQREFENAIAIAPDLPDAYIGLGGVYIAVNDYEKALDALNKAIKLNPDIPTAHYFLGTIYFRQDKYADAEESFQAILKIQPDHYEALNGLGRIRISNYEFDDGLEYFDKAIALDQSRVEAYLSKASVMIEMGKFEEAITLLEPFAEDDETIKPFISYAYYQMDRKSEADKMLQDAIRDTGGMDGFKLARAYSAIADVYISTHRFVEAGRYFDLAKDSNPLGWDAVSYLSFSYISSALGEFDEAEDSIRQAGLIGHSDLSLYLAKASLLINQEKLDDAEGELQSALQIDDRSANTHALLSFIHYQQNDFARAVVDAKTSLQLNPYNSNAHSQLAFAYQAMGRIDEALVEAQEAVRLNTLNDTSHYILAVCYMQSGMSEEAIGEFEKFLTHHWDRAYIREYRVKAEKYLEQLKQTP